MRAAAEASPGCMILGAGAAVLLVLLGIGWVLPGTWSAERSTVLQAPPSAIFALADTPEGWKRWTPWPDSGVVREGPARGAGARLSWNDEQLGDGSFEIIQAEPDSLVRYRVVVQKGSMHTDGTLRLAAEDGGTRVLWREEGDFGANPLMGYWARFMERAQGAELEKALRRLDELAAGGRRRSGRGAGQQRRGRLVVRYACCRAQLIRSRLLLVFFMALRSSFMPSADGTPPS